MHKLIPRNIPDGWASRTRPPERRRYKYDANLYTLFQNDFPLSPTMEGIGYQYSRSVVLGGSKVSQNPLMGSGPGMSIYGL